MKAISIALFGASYPASAEELAIEGYSVALVRATLEEAARMVCPWCCEETDAKGNHDGAVRADPQGVRWVHRIRSRPCLAMRIHDLIAAMDGEASHE